MEDVSTEDVEEEVDEVEVNMAEEVVEEVAAHMKMELVSDMSLITLKIQSGLHSQTIQGNGSLKTRYAQSSWRIKRGLPPAPSVLKRIKKLLISQIITGVQNASQNEYGLAGGVTLFPTNGRRAQVSAANRDITSSNRNEIDKRSVVIYDHLGKLVTKT